MKMKKEVSGSSAGRYARRKCSRQQYIGSNTAVVAVDSLQWAFERHCPEWAGAQVRLRGGLLPTIRDGSDRQAAV